MAMRPIGARISARQVRGAGHTSRSEPVRRASARSRTLVALRPSTTDELFVFVRSAAAADRRRPLRDRAQDRQWRHGSGVPRAPGERRQPGRDQVPAGGARRRRGPASAFRARGRVDIASHASWRRAAPRRRPGRRRASLSRLRVRRRRRSLHAARPRRCACLRRSLRRHAQGRRGARLRTPEGRRSSRHQAREHPRAARPGGVARQGARLRHRAGDRRGSDPAHGRRKRRRNPALHGAGADSRAARSTHAPTSTRSAWCCSRC